MQDPNFLANGLLGGNLANSLGAGALADSLGLTQVLPCSDTLFLIIICIMWRWPNVPTELVLAKDSKAACANICLVTSWQAFSRQQLMHVFMLIIYYTLWPSC